MNTNPVRVQLSRKKGWRKPESTVVVSRPSRWGNPFRLLGASVVGLPWFEVKALPMHAGVRVLDGEVYYQSHSRVENARAASVGLFRTYCEVMVRDYRIEFEAWLWPLRGKNLACWCPLDQPCHADVLLELANGGSL